MFSLFNLFSKFWSYQIMSDLSEQVASLKERAERAEEELETYKRESKEMEELLQGEAAKKEAEIRKLKQQSIMKEKNFKNQKAELAQLQTENAKLKEEITKNQTQSQGVDPAVFAKLEAEVSALKKANEQLKQEFAKQKQSAAALSESSKHLQAQWQKKQARFKQDLEMAKSLAEELKKLNGILNEKVNSLSKVEQVEKKVSKEVELERQSSKKEIKLGKQEKEKFEQKMRQYEQKMKQYEQIKRRLQQSLGKSEKTIKQLRFKNQTLADENQALQAKILALGTMSNSNSQSVFQSPFTIKSVIEEEDNFVRINYSCLLLTKPHYVSPFLQLDEDKNLLKIYKSTRTGCFEKSMGIYKHKFDVLSYQQDQIIDPIVKNITESDEITNHSIVLFGVKKSSKKYLMAKIISKLKDFLLGKLEGEAEPSSIFMIRSQEEEKNLTEKGCDEKSISDTIDKVIGLGNKKQKGKEKLLNQKKAQSKPKIRYFNFRTANFYLEIGTSSFTNLSFRDKMTSTNMLNNILYSKLPDILQSTISQKYLILTLNPIVDLYEDCRNTLSTTFCKAAIQPREEEEVKDWRASPAREELNEVAKKKLENIERQSEQTSIKIRKLEEECSYFKARFDQLEFRLKNLLNTHAGQNSYLKKSPVTLSYEKLLKYVHSVQSRTATSLNATLLGSNSMLFKSNANLEKECESPDAL